MTRKRHIQPHLSHPSLKNEDNAEKTKLVRHRPAGATFTRSKATARGREKGGDDIGQRGQPLTRTESHCLGSRRRRGRHRPVGATFTRSKATARGREKGGDDKGRRGQPLTRTESHCPGSRR